MLSGDKVLFNDLLGNTLGVKDQSSYQPIRMTAFGESDNADAFFTGKPLVGELGYTFLFRNYRPDQGKWQTADPLGYPDGWNNFAYVNNNTINGCDPQGTCTYVLGVLVSRCDVKNETTETLYGKKTIIVELQVGCSSGEGAEYKDPMEITLGINGVVNIWGISIPVNISWNWTPPKYSIGPYVCDSDQHVAMGGRKHVQFYVQTAAEIKLTQYECGAVSYEVLQKWQVQGNQVTVLTKCE